MIQELLEDYQEELDAINNIRMDNLALILAKSNRSETDVENSED